MRVVRAPPVNQLHPRGFPAFQFAQDLGDANGAIDVRNVLHHHMAIFERIYPRATALG
jgi:hypothetical protein